MTTDLLLQPLSHRPLDRRGSVTFIGTATVLVRLGTFTFLTDPNFLHAGDHAHLGYGLRSQRLTDPALELSELPPLDFVLLSHHHGDHFDHVVERLLDRTLPIITEPDSAKKLRKLGFQSERGVEQYVVGRARAAGKQVVGLETIEFQMGLFDSLPREQQQALLEQTLDELDEGAATLDEMVAAWRAGELEALSAELFEEFADYPGLYEKLVTKRNSAWVPAFEGMLDDGGRHLVVVGALHLVGPGNVIELLKKRGHDVERLH